MHVPAGESGAGDVGVPRDQRHRDLHHPGAPHGPGLSAPPVLLHHGQTHHPGEEVHLRL